MTLVSTGRRLSFFFSFSLFGFSPSFRFAYTFVPVLEEPVIDYTITACDRSNTPTFSFPSFFFLPQKLQQNCAGAGNRNWTNCYFWERSASSYRCEDRIDTWVPLLYGSGIGSAPAMKYSLYWLLVVGLNLSELQTKEDDLWLSAHHCVAMNSTTQFFKTPFFGHIPGATEPPRDSAPRRTWNVPTWKATLKPAGQAQRATNHQRQLDGVLVNIDYLSGEWITESQLCRQTPLRQKGRKPKQWPPCLAVVPKIEKLNKYECGRKWGGGGGGGNFILETEKVSERPGLLHARRGSVSNICAPYYSNDHCQSWWISATTVDLGMRWGGGGWRRTCMSEGTVWFYGQTH